MKTQKINPALLQTVMAEKYAVYAESESILLQLFIAAHKNAPGELSIEIGTDDGRTAEMFLRLIETLYAAQKQLPYFLTVDPYGGRPYMHTNDAVSSLHYGDRIYTLMKHRLSSFSNHIHWHMSSVDFLNTVAGQTRLWRDGESRLIRDFAFAFIDGEHSEPTIRAELALLRPLMHKNGIIIVDDIHWDPATVPMLEKYSPEIYNPGSPVSAKAIIRGRK